MKKNLLLLLLLSLLTLSAFSQTAPSIKWQKPLGGTSLEYGYDIWPTTDGGCVLAGLAGSTDGDVAGNHGGGDVFLVKLDASGAKEWEKSYGGTDNDGASSIQQTTDGGYIVAGYSSSNNGDVTGHHNGVDINNDFWILKLDAAGAIKWKKSLGGTGDDVAKSIQQTADGGYIVAGYTISKNGDVTTFKGNYDMWVVKLDTAGVIKWQKSYGGPKDDRANAIKQTPDGGYIVAGYSFGNGGDVTGYHQSSASAGGDYWIVKIDSLGTLQWQKCYGGTKNDQAIAITTTNDSGYIVTGFVASSDGNVTGFHTASGPQFDCWVVKIDASGGLQWQKSLGGTRDDAGYSVLQNSSGNYVVAGYTYSNDGDVTANSITCDAWLVNLSAAGSIIWQKSYGGSSLDQAYSIKQALDGGYFFAGWTSSNNGDVSGNHSLNYDAWVVRFKSDSAHLTQTINFPDPPEKTLLDEDFQLIATASSGLPVSFASTDTSIISIISGNIAHIKKKGVVLITATQPGDATYAAATPVSKIAYDAGFSITGFPAVGYACSNAPVTFGTTIVNSSPGVVYQWKKNGLPVGSSATYTDTLPHDADTIKCVVTFDGKTDSGQIKITVKTALTPSIKVIQNPGFPICYGTSIRFRATNIFGGGGAPVYQWMKNNIAVGTNSSEYVDNALNDKDSVWVVVTSSYPCVTAVAAVSNKIFASVSTGLPPKPSAISGPSSVAANQAGIGYSVPTVADVTYLWSIPADASFVTDKHNSSVTVNWGSTAGNVVAQTRNGCGYSAKKVLAVSVSPSFVSSGESSQLVTTTGKAALYPNPAKNFATVSFTAAERGWYLLQLTDASGKLLLNRQTLAVKGQNTITLNVSSYAKGSYFVRLTNKDGKQHASFTLVVAR